MVQEIEQLSNKCKALNSNTGAAREKNKMLLIWDYDLPQFNMNST
jgi:hypothetical protein